MRIIYVIHHPGSGGMEKYAYLLAKYAINSGHEIDFVFDHDGPLVDELRELGCGISFIKMRAPYDLIAVWNLVKLFKKLKPDVVHTNFMRENFLVIDASKFVKIPAIFTTIHRLEPKNRLQKVINCFYLKRLTKVIAVSPLAKQYVLNEGIGEGKIVVVLNGAEINVINTAALRKEIGIKKVDKVISYVGRFTEEKGHKTLLKAFSLLKDKNFKLILVGDGELRQYMVNYAKKLKINNRVIFTGTRKNGYDLIGISDLYVQPSEIENLPLSVEEAMLLNTPIIASDCDAHKWLLNNGDRGFLFRNKDTKDLAIKIEFIFNKKSEAIERAKKANEYAELHLTAKKMWEKTEKVYEKYI